MEKERSAEVVLYQPDERTKLEVQLDADTVWLTQQQIAQLFGVQKARHTVVDIWDAVINWFIKNL